MLFRSDQMLLLVFLRMPRLEIQINSCLLLSPGAPAPTPPHPTPLQHVSPRLPLPSPLDSHQRILLCLSHLRPQRSSGCHHLQIHQQLLPAISISHPPRPLHPHVRHSVRLPHLLLPHRRLCRLGLRLKTHPGSSGET